MGSGLIVSPGNLDAALSPSARLSGRTFFFVPRGACHAPLFTAQRSTLNVQVMSRLCSLSIVD
ncbi:hypothetical protein bAD24_I12765 [Burkholderia sp. AD24]|nr:hypothetical protein bAD24_I12765 [Burkholderia sp. AD24]